MSLRGPASVKWRVCVYSEWFKDNLPGLEEPSVPATSDCFGGVSINSEQAVRQAAYAGRGYREGVWRKTDVVYSAYKHLPEPSSWGLLDESLAFTGSPDSTPSCLRGLNGPEHVTWTMRVHGLKMC